MVQVGATALRLRAVEQTDFDTLKQICSAGGHTAEMLTLVKGLDRHKYGPRCYIAADTDRLGFQKAQQAEAGHGEL